MGTVPRVDKGQEIDTGDWDWDEKRDIEAILEKLGWRGVADAHAWYEDKGGPPHGRTPTSSHTTGWWEGSWS